MDHDPDYLTIEEAARYLGLTPGQVRRLLRQFGLGDFVRASMRRQVLISKADLAHLRTAVRHQQPPNRGAA